MEAKELLICTTISSDLEEKRYVFSALYDSTKEKYVMPSLMLQNKESWDNQEYLYGTLYNTIRRWICCQEMTSDFYSITKDIPLEDFKEVKCLLDQALKMEML